MIRYAPKKHSREVGVNSRHPLLSFRNDFDELFNSWFAPPSSPIDPASAAGFVPKLDVVESKEQFTVTAELPGLHEDDIEITIDDDILCIRGEKKSEHTEEENNRYYCERTFGAFERRLHLQEQVDSEKIDAKFSKGILEITLPKLEEEKRRSRKVAVRGE